jgi:hypothetical protein
MTRKSLTVTRLDKMMLVGDVTRERATYSKPCSKHVTEINVYSSMYGFALCNVNC